jgi:hypothetical protein
LVDRGQFVPHPPIEIFDDPGIASHDLSPIDPRLCRNGLEGPFNGPRKH